MKTQSQTTEQKKINQFLFTEYEIPTKDGHFITISDSYRNIHGRIHKVYNEELKKYEYIAYDHAGSLMGKNEKLWQLKNELFINNREQLLEQAHQRRLESKEKISQTLAQAPQTPQAEERKKETEQVRHGKPAREQQVRGKEDSRKEELDALRDGQIEDRGEHEIEY